MAEDRGGQAVLEVGGGTAVLFQGAEEGELLASEFDGHKGD